MATKNHTCLVRRTRSNSSRTKIVRCLGSLLIIYLLLLPPASSFGGTSSYEKSNAGIKNIQASSPAFAGATDRNSDCVKSLAYDSHRSESWLAVDPNNPNHLVGTSKFFFDPVFYLFHLGSYVSGFTPDTDATINAAHSMRIIKACFQCAE